MPGKATPLCQVLTGTPLIADIPAAQSRIIVAMRIAVLAHAQKQDMRSYLKRQMGDALAAKRFAHVMEAMGDCWPEPIMVHRPCCARISYDEMLMIDLITTVVQEDIERFHGLLHEMLSDSERQSIHQAISSFTACFGEKRANQA